MKQNIMFNESASLSDEVANIVARMQGGENAFEELYEKTKRYVYYIAISNNVSPNDAEDVVQDTFIHFYRKYKDIQNPKAALAWIKRSAFGHSVDVIRKKKDSLITEIEETQGDIFDTNALVAPIEVPETLLEKKENARIISDILDNLSEDQRKCVVAFYFDECKVKDIAMAFNVPEGTVKTNLYQGRKKIEKGLNEYAKKHGVKVLTVAVIPLLSLAFSQKASACSLSLSFGTVASKALSDSVLEGTTVKAGTAIASKAVAIKIAIAVAVVGVASALVYTQVIRPRKDSTAITEVESSRVERGSVSVTTDAERDTASDMAEDDMVRANVKDGTYLAFGKSINKLTVENGVFEIEFTGVENDMSTYQTQLYNQISEEMSYKIRCSENNPVYGDIFYYRYPDSTGESHFETLEDIQKRLSEEKNRVQEYGEDAEDWHDTGFFFEISDSYLTGIYYWHE